MLAVLKKLLGDRMPVAEDPSHETDIASAVLLVEIARADQRQAPEEMRTVEHLLQTRFELTPGERAALLERAHSHADEAVSLQGYTRTLTEALSETERGDIIGMLWEVAYADGQIDPHEELLLRRVADLLYVRHSEFIRRKLETEQKNRG